MLEIKNPADCCGCTACASICSHNAITMKPDALGFLYPEVDVNKCTDCGLCEKVCAFHDNYDKSLNLPQPDAFAVRHKNIKELEFSRSGAVFIAISDYILENGGVVYGVGYTDHFRVVHKRAVTKNERNEFKGSKYVQSDLTGIFRLIKKDLKNGMTVLFSGTPCQTAALNSYIGKKLREKLFLVDIICHAVPSPFLYHDYLQAIEKRTKQKVTQVYFRDKRNGWYAPHQECFVMNDGKVVVDCTHRILFNNSLSTRLSCHSCKYCNINRPSDLTIGDFWGYEKTEAFEMNLDNKGISLLLINTSKGINLFDLIKCNLQYIKVPIDKCIQPNLKEPTKISHLRYKFEEDYLKRGFVYVAKKYANWGWEYRCKQFLLSMKRYIKNRLIHINS